MEGRRLEQGDYVHRLLAAYRATPGTSGAVRRVIRPAAAAPLGTVRSLAYFLPVIEEVLQLNVGQEYFQHLRHRLQRAATER